MAHIEDLRGYEALRRVRTDVIQDEARRNGLRFDSRTGSLEQRDRELAEAGRFRRRLYDYDVEAAALSARAGQEVREDLAALAPRH